MSSDLTTNKRRRFFHQPNINNYFFPSLYSTSFAGAALSPSGPISPSGLLSPSLPPDVQASLFQVGMRVRKSVAEGYKTAAQDTASARAEFKKYLSTNSFHGSYTPYADVFSSQDSITTDSDMVTTDSDMATTVPPTANRKRSLSTSSDVAFTSPTLTIASTIPATATRGSMSPPLRPIAQAKTRRRQARSPVMSPWGGWEYDEAMKIDDFGEAEFLKPLDGRDGGGRAWGAWMSSL